MRVALACLALLVLAAGCSDPAPPGAEAAGEADAGRTGVAADAGPDQSETEFGWLAAAEAPVAGNVQVESSNRATLDVSEGRTVLHANATWTCATGPCDLHLYLCSPADETTACSEHAMGSSPLVVEVSDPMPGEWQVGMFASGGAAEVSGTVVLTAA